MVTIIGLKKNGRTVELTTDDIKIAEAFIKQLETFSYIEKEEDIPISKNDDTFDIINPGIEKEEDIPISKNDDTFDIINPGCIHVIVPKASSMSGR